MNPSRRSLLVASATGLAWGAAVSGQGTPLRLGLAPFLSPSALLTVFRPLREHLGRALQQPVEAYTTRDFRTLIATVQRSDYEIALVPAHLAAVAVTDWRWWPLAHTITSSRVQVLVRQGGPIDTPGQLQGGRIGMLDAMSLTAAVGTTWLASQGLNAPVDAQEVALPSINSALVALARDEVAAVVAAASQLAGLPANTPTNFRTLAQLDHIPGPMLIGQPEAAAATVQRWREALLSFEPDPSRPATAANTRHQPLAAGDLAPLEPYAAYLRRQLADGR